MLTNFYPYLFNFDFVDPQNNSFLDKMVNDLSQVPEGSKIIMCCMEWMSADNVLDFMSKIIQKIVDKKIIWLLTDSFYSDEQKKRMKQIAKNLYFIEFDILSLHFEIDLYKTSIVNDQWNPSTENFLFLTGKPNRLNRIRLLYKFYKKNLLSNCTWSFHLNNELEKKSCRNFLKELSDQDYTDFVAHHQRNPDNITVSFGPGQSFHYDGYPFDKKLFSQCSFRVIAETMMMQQPIITEKTWTTMINRMPFIMAGYPGTLDILKNQGFRTFEKYLPVDNYDRIQDDDKRLDSIVENTEYWISNINVHKDMIAEDIEFNFQLLSKKMKDTVSRFDKLYSELGEISFEKFRILPVPIQRVSWINFYYGIKDPTWPDCWTEKDFFQLPQHVRREMKEVYQYQPKYH